MEILNVSESMTFESLFTAINTRQEVIVLFLAILELMRLRLIRVQQASYFDPIRIYKNADKETQEEILQNYQESEKSQANQEIGWRHGGFMVDALSHRWEHFPQVIN